MLRLIARSTRHRTVASLAALALCAVGSCVAASGASARSHGGAGTPPATWPGLAKAFAWPVLRPSDGAGLSQSQLVRAPRVCGSRTNHQAYSAAYGKAPGRWFELFVAKGPQCGDPPEAVPVSRITIAGRPATVWVWQFSATKPVLADGYAHGMTVSWKQGVTTVLLESTRLHLPEVLRIAKSLKRVHG
jgi:hypothetical protein